MTMNAKSKEGKFKRCLKFFALPNEKDYRRKGFSLLEILVALTLLGIAGTFVAGKIFKQLHEGRVKSANIQMQHLAGRLKEFRRHCGFYPSTEQGLEALISKPTSGRECKRYNPDGYIDGGKIPQDPWDSEYVYTSNGKKFNIASYGNGGEEGGEDEEKDIYLYEVKQ